MIYVDMYDLCFENMLYTIWSYIEQTKDGPIYLRVDSVYLGT